MEEDEKISLKGVISRSSDDRQGKITLNGQKEQSTPNRAGLMQKLFGYGADAKYGISGIVILCLFIVGVIFSVIICIDYWFFQENSSAKISDELKNVWSIITPLLTLTLGYIFGRTK